MTATSPIVNAGFKYINGFRLAWTSGTVITATAGQCRDSDNINDITSSATLTLNAATVGANGLDQGALANNTFYAVYAIGDSYNKVDTALILSTNTSAPLLPYQYNMYRRVGYVLTSGAAAILQFFQDGVSSDRWMWYDAPIQELNAGASAVYAAVDCASSVPAQATMIAFMATLTPTADNDKAFLQPTGGTNANGIVQLSGVVAAKIQVAQLIVPCNATPSVNYKVTGTLSLSTQGYLDQLS
jgi:hypothetical protein